MNTSTTEEKSAALVELRTTVVNGREHEVCSTCDCVVGHGCPQSEPCDCESPQTDE